MGNIIKNRNRNRRREKMISRENNKIWEVMKNHTDILKKMVYHSVNNGSFNENNWLQKLESVDKGLKCSLKSYGLEYYNKRHIKSWDTCIQTLKNVHKKRQYYIRQQYSVRTETGPINGGDFRINSTILGKTILAINTLESTILHNYKK